MESEIRDGMQIDWDAPIEMDDGLVLRADIFRPDILDDAESRHPRAAFAQVEREQEVPDGRYSAGDSPGLRLRSGAKRDLETDPFRKKI